MTALQLGPWRLEWLRLVRTRRWLVLFGTFTLFGLAGPITVHYLPQILGSQLAEMNVVLPPQGPADGMTEYAETLSGIGLIVVVAVAAGALCVDANPTLSTFYRTRIGASPDLLLPRYAITAAAVAMSFAAGTLAAWYETVVLLGPMPAPRVAVATAVGAVYLSFVVAVVAISASVVRSTLATVGVSLAALFLLPLISIYDPVGRWLPSALARAIDDVVRGEPATIYRGPLATTVALIPVMLGAAIWRQRHREL